jgi:hypothetical protein
LITLRALDPGHAGRWQDQLVVLLERAVASGASIDFLPLGPGAPAEAL